jgi:hypothetical protein
VASRTIEPDDVAIVVVGDRSVVEGPLERLGLGEVTIATVEDILGPPRLASPHPAAENDETHPVRR